jgi:hypothetical protein
LIPKFPNSSIPKSLNAKVAEDAEDIRVIFTAENAGAAEIPRRNAALGAFDFPLNPRPSECGYVDGNEDDRGNA